MSKKQIIHRVHADDLADFLYEHQAKDENRYHEEKYKNGKIIIIEDSGIVYTSVILPDGNRENDIAMIGIEDGYKWARDLAIHAGKYRIDTYWQMERAQAKSMEKVNRRWK